jgi:hypothetical protein
MFGAWMRSDKSTGDPCYNPARTCSRRKAWFFGKECNILVAGFAGMKCDRTAQKVELTPKTSEQGRGRFQITLDCGHSISAPWPANCQEEWEAREKLLRDEHSCFLCSK